MIQFQTTQSSALESSTNAQVLVGRTGGSEPVSVQFRSIPGGSAIAGLHHIPISGQLDFGVSEVFKIFSVPLIDDLKVEPDRTVKLELHSPVGALLGSNSMQTLTIQENDAVFRFLTNRVEVNEGIGMASIPVIREGGTGPMTIDFRTLDNGAIGGVDFVHTNSTLNFLSGILTQYIQVVIAADEEAENPESFHLRLENSAPLGSTLISNALAEVIISDQNPGAGNIGFSRTNFVSFENQPFAVFTLVRSNGLSGSVSVDISTAAVGGSATSNVDFIQTNGTIHFLDGESNKTFGVALIDDHEVEANKTFLAGLTNPQGGATLGVGTATMTIVENDSYGVFEFTNITFTVSESDQFFTTEVVRRGGTSGTVSVDFVTLPGAGTAVARVDYHPIAAVLPFLPGQTNQLVNVSLIDDAKVEPAETFEIELRNPVWGRLGFATNAVVTILDDDTEFLFWGTNLFATESFPAQVTMLRQGNADRAASVELVVLPGDPVVEMTNVVSSITTNLITNIFSGVPVLTVELLTNFSQVPIPGETNAIAAVPGVHFHPSTNLVEFPPGVLFTNVEVGLINDRLVQPDRNVRVSLVNPQPSNSVSLGALSVANLKVSDDDSVIAIRPGAYQPGVFRITEGNEGEESFLILVVDRFGTLFAGDHVEVEMTPINTDSEDAMVLTKTVQFGFEQSVAFITNKIFGDNVHELDEQFRIRLINPQNPERVSITNGEAIVTIVNDDISYGFVGFAGNNTSLREGESHVFEILRFGPSHQTSTVGFTTTDSLHPPRATSGLDYVATNGTLTFGPGITRLPVELVTLVDGLYEPFETFDFKLTQDGVDIPGAVRTVWLEDALDLIDFPVTQYRYSESQTNSALIQVRRQGLGVGAVTVELMVSAPGARAGYDYGQPSIGANGVVNLTSITNLQLTWADGEQGTKLFTLPIVNDTRADETNEIVMLSLTNPVGAGLGVSSFAEVTILDDDTPSTRNPYFDTKAAFNGEVLSIAEQVDGKLVIGGDFTRFTNSAFLAGSTQKFLIRLNPDGSVDTSFDVGFRPNAKAGAIHIVDDGRILVGGDFDHLGSGPSSCLVRFRQDGIPDDQFAPTLAGSVRSIDVQSDGSVIGVGSFSPPQGLGLVRISNTGRLDETFPMISGINGTLEIVRVYGTNAGPNVDKILIGGSFSSVDGNTISNLARLNSDGSFDGAFGSGLNPNGTVYDIRFDTNGDIVLAGAFTSMGASNAHRTARLDANGEFRWGSEMEMDGAVRSVVVEAPDSLLLGGSFQHGHTTTPGGTMLTLEHGRLCRISSQSTNLIVLPNGRRVDFLMPFNGIANDTVRVMRMLSDRRIVIGGAFTSYNSEPVWRFAIANGYSAIVPESRLIAEPPGNGEFRMRLLGEPGRNYRVDRSDDFESWESIRSIPSGSGKVSINEPFSGTPKSRYYRVIRLED